MEDNTVEINRFLLDVMTELGQMNHLSLSVGPKFDEELTDDLKKAIKKLQVRGAPDNVMTMKVEKRRELLYRGWELIKKLAGG